MRSNRLWIGVTCGVALALGGVAAVDAGTQTAGAAVTCPSAPNPNYPNCPPARVDRVTPSRARADRQSNPFTVSIRQHLIDQRIATAAVRRSNRAIKQQLWASLGPGGAIIDQSGPKSGTGSITSKRISTGRYEVDFKRNVSACSWTATPVLPANLANNPPPTPRTAVTARANGQPTGEVTVYVYEASVLKDSNVAVQVLC